MHTTSDAQHSCRSLLSARPPYSDQSKHAQPPNTIGRKQIKIKSIVTCFLPAAVDDTSTSQWPPHTPSLTLDTHTSHTRLAISHSLTPNPHSLSCRSTSSTTSQPSSSAPHPTSLVEPKTRSSKSNVRDSLTRPTTRLNVGSLCKYHPPYLSSH